MKRTWLRAAQAGALIGVVALRGRRRLAAWFLFEFLRLYPTLRRNCDWHGEVLTRFQTDAREVWLTIDDGPHEKDTPAILDLLAAYQARATFFVTGKNVRAHPGLCRRILAEGHQIGNHTYSHALAWWWTLPPFAVRREIRRGHEAIFQATNYRPRHFRPPVGMTPGAVHGEIARHGQRLVGWSLDSGDGRGLPPDAVERRLARGLFPGAILLMHEGGGYGNRIETLTRALDCLKSRGYGCVLPREEQLY